MTIKIINDVDYAISVMRNAGKWLKESGKKPSKWLTSQENLQKDMASAC